MEKHPGETINLDEKIYIIKEVDQYTWAFYISIFIISIYFVYIKLIDILP